MPIEFIDILKYLFKANCFHFKPTDDVCIKMNKFVFYIIRKTILNALIIFTLTQTTILETT